MIQQDLNLIINKAKKIHNTAEHLEKNNIEINKKMFNILDKKECTCEWLKLNNLRYIV